MDLTPFLSSILPQVPLTRVSQTGVALCEPSLRSFSRSFTAGAVARLAHRAREEWPAFSFGAGH